MRVCVCVERPALQLRKKNCIQLMIKVKGTLGCYWLLSRPWKEIGDLSYQIISVKLRHANKTAVRTCRRVAVFDSSQ